MELHMITTTDNPFSPVTQYDEWSVWDEEHGYYSNSLVARVLYTSDELLDIDRYQAIEDAIDEVVTENVSGVHTKVKAGTIDFPSEQLSSDIGDNAETSAA